MGFDPPPKIAWKMVTGTNASDASKEQIAWSHVFPFTICHTSAQREARERGGGGGANGEIMCGEGKLDGIGRYDERAAD